MRNFFASLLVAVTLCSSGCGDKEAREYAAKMVPVLDSYQEQLTQKIKAEQQFYEELADTYDEARKADITIRLASERRRRSEELGEKVATAKEPPTLLQLFASLQEYAKSDFEATQSVLQEGLDARSKYLSDLESLEVELQKVKALKEALKDLSKPNSDFKKFKGAADFILQTDAEVTKLLCADLKKEVAQLNESKKSASADEKKQLDQRIAQVTERMKTKSCS